MTVFCIKNVAKWFLYPYFINLDFLSIEKCCTKKNIYFLRTNPPFQLLIFNTFRDFRCKSRIAIHPSLLSPSSGSTW